ncbi:MAG: HAMP domain-containing protein [Rhodospirillales bacterium]
MGLTLATHISRPISGLIAAAERVRDGDMAVRVKPVTTIGEFAMLARAFNRMTSQLQSQQAGLLLANGISTSAGLPNGAQRRRRRWSVSTAATIDSAQPLGIELLGLDLNAVRGTPLAEVVPEMAELIRTVDQPERSCEAEVRLIRASARTLIVRIAAERRPARFSAMSSPSMTSPPWAGGAEGGMGGCRAADRPRDQNPHSHSTCVGPP